MHNSLQTFENITYEYYLKKKLKWGKATGSNKLVKCLLRSFDSKNTCLHQKTASQVDYVLSFHFWKLVPVQQPEAHGNITTTMLSSKVGKKIPELRVRMHN